MVTWENYEEYMLLDADGELNEEEAKALQDFIVQHPELKKEYTLIKATVLLPDTNVVYENKEQLQKGTGKTISLPIKKWIYSAAACIIAALLLIAILNRKDNTNEIAKTNTAKPEKNISPNPVKDIHSSHVKPVTIKTEKKNISKTYVAKTLSQPVKPINTHENEPPSYEPLQALPSASIEYALILQKPGIIEEPDISRIEPSNEITSNNKDLFAVLNKEKPAGISDFSNSLSQKINKVKSVAQAIKSTDLTVKIGNHDLFNVQF